MEKREAAEAWIREVKASGVKAIYETVDPKGIDRRFSALLEQ